MPCEERPEADQYGNRQARQDLAAPTTLQPVEDRSSDGVDDEPIRRLRTAGGTARNRFRRISSQERAVVLRQRIRRLQRLAVDGGEIEVCDLPPVGIDQVKGSRPMRDRFRLGIPKSEAAADV